MSGPKVSDKELFELNAKAAYVWSTTDLAV